MVDEGGGVSVVRSLRAWDPCPLASKPLWHTRCSITLVDAFDRDLQEPNQLSMFVQAIMSFYPYLYYNDAKAAKDWLIKICGFEHNITMENTVTLSATLP